MAKRKERKPLTDVEKADFTPYAFDIAASIVERDPIPGQKPEEVDKRITSLMWSTFRALTGGSKDRSTAAAAKKKN